MKKNLMMRIASFLLVAVLISTSAISGTYAKYTTQDAGGDEARVAKWGVELQVFGNLYGDSYGKDDLIVKDDDGSITVQSLHAADDVVAPGTKNAEGFEISLKGQPEVDGKITTIIETENIFLKEGTYGIMVEVDDKSVTADNFDEITEDDALYFYNGTTYVKADDYQGPVAYYTLEDDVVLDLPGTSTAYYPVVYMLEGDPTKYTKDDCSVNSLDDIAVLLVTALEGDPATFTPGAGTAKSWTINSTFESNTKLADKFHLNDLRLTWRWAFDWDGCEKVGDAACQYSKADTILGHLMADTPKVNVVKLVGENTYGSLKVNEDYCLNTRFNIDITVTQVD